MRPEFLTALEFAQGADAITDPRALNDKFGEVVAAFGVRYHSAISIAAAGQGLTPQVLSGVVNPEWTEHYVRRNFGAVDPAMRMIFETHKPFTWAEAAERSPETAGRRVFDEAADVTGATQGLVIPIHERFGATSAVILSGPGLEISPETRPVLHLAAVYFSGAAQDLAARGPLEPDCPLTERQRECLRWVMDGKSDWEIGGILGISERTAHNHIEAAKRSLGVGTRTQAFVQAWRRGWLV